jgi:hypothetical protein
MSIERIPVSLKIDTESEFFIELLGPLRDSKGLSEFILNLMKAYHEDHVLRDLANSFSNQNSSRASLSSQLDRIASEHQKSIGLTHMLTEQVSQTRAMAAGQADNIGLPAGVEVEPQISTRLNSLEERMESILELLEKSLVSGTKTQTPTTEAVIQQTLTSPAVSEEPSQVHTHTHQNVIVEEEVAVSQAIEPKIPTPNFVDMVSNPSASQPVQEIQAVAVPPASVQPVVTNTIDEPAPPDTVKRAPASFGRAKSSVNKTQEE